MRSCMASPGLRTCVELLLSCDAAMLRCRRHVHASDVVPRVPAGLGYVHHGVSRFIPSFDISDTVR